MLAHESRPFSLQRFVKFAHNCLLFLYLCLHFAMKSVINVKYLRFFFKYITMRVHGPWRKIIITVGLTHWARLVWKTTTGVNQSPASKSTMGWNNAWKGSRVFIDLVVVVLQDMFMAEVYPLGLLFEESFSVSAQHSCLVSITTDVLAQFRIKLRKNQ